MKIELKEITIREVVNGYLNNDEEGVVGYGGKLNIRPIYQREFIYKDPQRDAVIITIREKCPLNTIYWAKNEDGTYEVLDGQQRIISICEYVSPDAPKRYCIDHKYFQTLTGDEQEQILDYKLQVYVFEGTDSEKLKWFQRINIAGEKLTEQELLNATYTGCWLTDAKRYFSKSTGPVHNIASDYLTGSANRQDYLETAIGWISKGNIEQYMADNKHKENANELWLYFQNIINWIKVIFPNYRKEMKGVPFGLLYNDYKDTEYDAKTLEKEIKKLLQDEDVTKKSGIYQYVLTRNQKHLNIRSFTDNQKREAYERQEGFCPKCNKEFEIDEMEGDHTTPWSKGGKTISKNCQMLCKDCNRTKSGK